MGLVALTSIEVEAYPRGALQDWEPQPVIPTSRRLLSKNERASPISARRILITPGELKLYARDGSRMSTKTPKTSKSEGTTKSTKHYVTKNVGGDRSTLDESKAIREPAKVIEVKKKKTATSATRLRWAPMPRKI